MIHIKIKVIQTVSPELCECHYQVNDEWNMTDTTLPEGICIGAMSALLPWITCIKYQAKMPWTAEGKIKVCCTDPDHPVVFEIESLE